MDRLLLKTKDNRNFLTYEKNESSIVEFAKTFNAEVYRVELIKGNVLELKKLAKAFCDPDYQSEPTFNKIEKIFPTPSKTRDQILKDAQKIKKFIEQKMKTGQPLSLKDLKDKYSKYDITDACLCNHFSQVRKALENEGLKIEKVGAGSYCLNQTITN